LGSLKQADRVQEVDKVQELDKPAQEVAEAAQGLAGVAEQLECLERDKAAGTD